MEKNTRAKNWFYKSGSGSWTFMSAEPTPASTACGTDGSMIKQQTIEGSARLLGLSIFSRSLMF